MSGFPQEGWERVSIKDLDVDWSSRRNGRIEAWRATQPASFDGPQAVIDPERGPCLQIPVDGPTRAPDTWVHV